MKTFQAPSKPPRPVADPSTIRLDSLQGNILKSHGRDHSTHLFVRFGNDADQTRRWLRSMLPGGSSVIQITSHAAQVQQTEAHRGSSRALGELFVNLLLSATGYVALNAAAAPLDASFRNGMMASGDKLSDPPPSQWDAGFRDRIDAMVLLAHDDRKQLASFDSEVRKELVVAGAVVVAVEYGDALRNEQGNHIEHFGYVDGRSQPLFLQEEVDKERDETDGISVWNPSEDAHRLLLVADPAAGIDRAFGSYFVFRKLEQNVQGFKNAEARLAGLLGLQGDDAERAGAMLVGRFEDGTPVVNMDVASGSKEVANNFDYGKDPQGRRCPFHAHIRKMNPRGDLVTRFGGDEEVLERSRRIARRGIPYGLRASGLTDRPERDVGLLFMCFQRNIAEQFEFMQASWGNSAGFPVPGTGADPVIGQGPDTSQPQRWPNGWNEADLPFQFTFRPFVTLKGGCYLFAPSLAGLAAL